MFTESEATCHLDLTDAQVEAVVDAIEGELQTLSRQVFDTFQQGSIEPFQYKDARSWLDQMLQHIEIVEKLGVIGPRRTVADLVPCAS